MIRRLVIKDNSSRVSERTVIEFGKRDLYIGAHVLVESMQSGMGSRFVIIDNIVGGTAYGTLLPLYTVYTKREDISRAKENDQAQR